MNFYLFSGTSQILNDPRFNINLDKRDSTYTLRIEEIQETDGAIYQCQVIISLTDKEIADVPLIVRRPPVISGINCYRPITISEGTGTQNPGFRVLAVAPWRNGLKAS